MNPTFVVPSRIKSLDVKIFENNFTHQSERHGASRRIRQVTIEKTRRLAPRVSLEFRIQNNAKTTNDEEMTVSELESVEVAVSPSDKFQEYLATQGMRLTQERATVVDDVFSQHEHFDAEQIVERLTSPKDGRRVSRASVYRTLTLLEEAGLIRKVARSNDREVYEHDYGYPQHDHLICSECGDMIEFHNSEISNLLEQIAQDHGFRKTGHRLEVFGRCQACSRPQKRNPKLDLL